ncbi:MAG: valine--tRNA ligase [Dethiobacter sp.]|nr:valine--tRNA ligase [Dethiobacter sp.]
MTERNLAPVYNPEAVEGRIYGEWLAQGYFRAPGDPTKETFTIAIPPPNVTGSLHMGHALDNTIQDILIRRQRMRGVDTLWLPGTDHAGIATQIKVEEHLAEEGVTRHDLGRERFLERVWEWKEEYHRRIVRQLQKLGVSCDWSRERFTMDEGCSRAVKEVFVSLYEQGLIYRGDYITNWCPRCHTALSDIEVEHEEETGNLYFIGYPVIDGEDMLVVATTRPETMLGDTAVAVNPGDVRYQSLIGSQLLLPLLERPLPVIADEYVDPEFGSGAVKITPAHDPNDFLVAARHGLPAVTVIGDDGRMTAAAGLYAGLDRYEARRRILEDLQEAGLLLPTKEHKHALGHCQRCRTVIEPLLSKQWFVRMKPLAEPAIAKVKSGEIRFVPERFTRVYLNWVENIRDWCISRQIWWGHRIPAWYCACGKTVVAREEPTACPTCNGALVQDPDVLDTWFSSALWPFSTLGWPERTEDLAHYYPTSVLVTGYDIIYFWVARMIFMGLEFMKEVPFHTVYIHGLVRDAQGRKMSKSLGNGIDPLEVIDKYGTDTLRFTLVTGQAPGNDQRFRQENVESSRNFANKIWNASRFVLMNVGDAVVEPPNLSGPLSDADRWILHRYNETVRQVNRLMEQYELGEAARHIYDFLWSDFCDWYVEMAKIPLYTAEQEAEKQRARSILVFVLDGTLRLLHPFMPFITEEIWRRLPLDRSGATIMLAPWPKESEELVFSAAHGRVNLVMEVTRAIRYLRSEVQLPPAAKVEVILHATEEAAVSLAEGLPVLQKLAHVGGVHLVRELPDKPRQSLTAVAGEVEIYLPLAGLLDLAQERQRLEKELKNMDAELDRCRAKLQNEAFLSKAPAQVVDGERVKEAEYHVQREKVLARLGALQ